MFDLSYVRRKDTLLPIKKINQVPGCLTVRQPLSFLGFAFVNTSPNSHRLAVDY